MNKYELAYKELGELIESKSRDYNKMIELCNICITGQRQGLL